MNNINFYKRACISLLCLFPVAFSNAATPPTGRLYVGTAVADITPALPVALKGQFALRVATKATSPLLANVLALESRPENGTPDISFFVSCDLIDIPRELTVRVRGMVHEQLPDIDVNKIVLNATHVHTAPVLENGLFKIPAAATQVNAYQAFFVERVATAIVKAWKTRVPGAVTWGLGAAVIAHSRRAVYADGSAVMYGKPDNPGFRGIEAAEDHDLNALFFWNQAGKLIGASIDVPCPAQVYGSETRIDADYWHPVRQALQKRFGKELVVVSWAGAAGDQSPGPIYRKAAYQRMLTLNNRNNAEEIARRIVQTVSEVYETGKKERQDHIVFEHKVANIELPMRVVTTAEYEETKKVVDRDAASMAADSSTADKVFRRMVWYQDVLRRFEVQKTNPHPVYETEIHVLRIGNIAVCTNQFELFTDYGTSIQGRSKALQTFVVQLAGPGTYLPTERAISGGGYSAICQSNLVGAEGGRALVDHTVSLINEMWP